MKVQYILFLLVVLGIIFLVNQSDRSEVDEARERMLERQQQVIIDEDEMIPETDQEVREDDTTLDIWSEHWQSDTSEIDEVPAASLEVPEIMELSTPSFVEFWDAVSVSNTSFVYNQVRGLEIFREQQLQEIMCEDITDFLTERLRSWFFWNTCRPIVSERGLKFNVLRLDWENYIYERHYIDTTASLYWVLELERWTGIDRENIAEKNTELRDVEFPLIEVWDSLMRELLWAN